MASQFETLKDLVRLGDHDHHSDNLDPGGREFLSRAGRVLTTADGAVRLGGNALGMEPWSSAEVTGAGGTPVTVTAVPAQHGPDGSDAIMGPVIGFVLAASDLEPVYVSGDNASLDVVRAIAQRVGPIGIATPRRSSQCTSKAGRISPKELPSCAPPSPATASKTVCGCWSPGRAPLCDPRTESH